MKLLPCPKCQSIKVEIIKHGAMYHTEHWPLCAECRLTGPIFDDEKSAIEWWNARTTDPLMEKMAKALNDLTFDCFEFFNTKAPSIETYNRAFKVLQEYKEKSNG